MDSCAGGVEGQRGAERGGDEEGEEDFRLRRTCTHEEHGFGEKIFAVEDMPSLWVYCTCERGEHVGAALVFVSGCSRLRSIRDPHGHRFHLGP
jgi:hypothetical protein